MAERASDRRAYEDGLTATAAAAALWPIFRDRATGADEEQWRDMLDLAAIAAAGLAQEDGLDPVGELAVHRVLYAIYAGRILVPWSPQWRDLDDVRVDLLRRTLETGWDAAERRRLTGFFGPLPQVADFAGWATHHCQAHRSNVGHPLFDFLSDRASFDQLRSFIVQETPFDIHFGDIVAMMLQGVHGGAKAEFSRNFWDEMGRGDQRLAHRQLRLDMMTALGVREDVHVTEVEAFCLEELRLANMYFHGVFNRALLPQAIGMMLATELMVPGRLDRQIQGWRRVGLDDDTMRYLIEHTVVDIEHAAGWMNEVVLPMLAERPEVMGEIVLGMARRLEHAAAVCDRMMTLLPAAA